MCGSIAIEPVGVDRSSILVRPSRMDRRQLLDDSVEEVLAELDFGASLDPSVREHQPAENAQE